MNLSIVDISLVFGLIRDDQTSEKMGQWGQGGMCLKTEPWGGAWFPHCPARCKMSRTQNWIGHIEKKLVGSGDYYMLPSYAVAAVKEEDVYHCPGWSCGWVHDEFGQALFTAKTLHVLDLRPSAEARFVRENRTAGRVPCASNKLRRGAGLEGLIFPRGLKWPAGKTRHDVRSTNHSCKTQYPY